MYIHVLSDIDLLASSDVMLDPHRCTYVCLRLYGVVYNHIHTYVYAGTVELLSACSNEFYMMFPPFSFCEYQSSCD